jgi:hypothetical protein
MSKLGLIVAIFVFTVSILKPVSSSANQLNSAPNDDVIAGIKALHRAPEKEMARLKTLLDENKSAAKRHEFIDELGLIIQQWRRVHADFLDVLLLHENR